MKRTDTIARAPGALPLIGHAASLLRDPLGFLRTLPDSGDVVRIRLGPYQAFVLCDPELTYQVLRDDRAFEKGGPLFDGVRDLSGNALATCGHDEHRRQRNLTQPAFHRSRFAGYAAVMAEHVAHMVESWEDGQSVDVLAEMMALTTRTTVETMFASTLPDSTVDGMIDDVGVIMADIYKRAFIPWPLNRIPTPGKRRYERARDRFRATLGEIIAGYRASGVDHGDLLSILLATRADSDDNHRDPTRFSDDEIIDQVTQFCIGGMETAANTLAWALHLLAHDPDVQRRLRAEVDTVLTDATATYDDVPALELTDRVINETLRLYPPLWMLTRTTTAETRLGRHTIPARATLVYSPYLLHHRADLFSAPERFDPDRWAEPASAPPRGAMVPFGAGNRKCIGDHFAMIETALTLASVVARWEVEPVAGTRVRPAASLILTPRGLRLRVRARTRTGAEESDRAEPAGGRHGR